MLTLFICKYIVNINNMLNISTRGCFLRFIVLECTKINLKRGETMDGSSSQSTTKVFLYCIEVGDYWLSMV